MKNKNRYILLLFAMVVYQFSIAQSISRSTICSFGATQTGSNGQILQATFGQCPGCTTLNAANGSFLTQGFQQPSIDITNADCEGLADFDFDEEVSLCGNTFSFFYTGWADINNATFMWNFGGNAFPQTSADANPMGVSFGSAGTRNITLTVIFEDCEISQTNELVAQNVGFGVNATVSNVSCDGEDDGNIQLTFANGTAPFEIAWSTGAETQSLINLPMGNYAYTVVDANGCQTTNSVSVEGPDDPLTINFTTTKVSCGTAQDGQIIADITGGTAPYALAWSNGVSENQISNLLVGEYTLSVTDVNGCALMETELVREACQPTIYNIISPNGDNLNDVWLIEDISDFPNNELKIYNRWGSLVYEMSSYNNNWSGTDNNGNPLLAGAYYYVLQLNNEAQTVLTGSITLIQ